MSALGLMAAVGLLALAKCLSFYVIFFSYFMGKVLSRELSYF